MLLARGGYIKTYYSSSRVSSHYLAVSIPGFLGLLVLLNIHLIPKLKHLPSCELARLV